MEFAILGPVEASRAGQPIALGGPKQRALLAIFLLRANQVVSRDRLIDGLWGERPPPGAGQTLDSYVSRLRKALEPDRLIRRSSGYVLRVEPGELDLDQFERLAAAGDLQAALALWRGPALADLLFEPFAAAEAERLEERRLGVIEEWLEAQLAAGSGAELVSELEQLVGEHPLRERLLGQLMLALYRSGRQTAALEAYRRAKRNLTEELGLEPGPHLQELERRILAHDPALQTHSRVLDPVPPTVWRRRAALVVAAVAVTVGAAVGAVLGTRGSSIVRVDPAASRLVSIDRHSHRIGATSVLVNAPSALVAGFGSLWATDPNGEQVLRIDERSGAITDRIEVGAQPSAIVVGGGAVWVASTVGGFVTRIDPATAKRTETQHLGGANPSALAFARERLWVADLTDHSLVEIDPDTGSIRRSITLNLAPTALAAGAGEIWAAGYGSAAVNQVDLASGQVVAQLPVGQGPSAILLAAGSAWVANSLDGTLTRINAITGKTQSTTPIGSGPAALTAADGSVWVANEYSGTVAEVDARSGDVRATIHPGGQPTSLASAGARLWVGADAVANLHHGGTLRLSGTSRPNSLDSAFNHTGSFEPPQLTRLAYDTLVTFDNAAGSRGLRLVPDLALQLPQATDAGTTYVFRLRPGIRYSNGRLVQAGDFRRSFERLFRAHSPGADFYTSIVGANACTRRPQTCSLSQGIVSNDTAGTVIFHLARPDPDFLFKLTEFAFGAPVPPGTPNHDLGLHPGPGTGPYRFAKTSKNGLRLQRNPYFREWSHAAQPAGNPDTIVWRFPPSHAAEIRDIEQGKADWTFDFIPIPQLRLIERNHPGLLHINPAFIVEFIALNTNLPPFDSVKVRRALNYAIDRREIARLYGGSHVATPLCQPLPPGMPGYVRYCPYTVNAKASGTYNGPDLKRARKLVATSGRRGSHVVVQAVPDAVAIPPAEPAYIARVLKSLGFKVTIHRARSDTITLAQRRTFQFSVDGDWLLDFPTAGSFLPPFFGCHAPYNNHYYCNPSLDRLMQAATLAGAQDPARANRLWAAADHLITDQAYWIPTVNLREVDLVSSRVHNYTYNPVWGFLADQAWVR